MGKITVAVLYFLVTCFGKSIAQIPMLSVRKDMRFCYTAKYNGIDTLVNIEGYYRTMINRSDEPFDSIMEYSFIFYGDGFVLFTPWQSPESLIDDGDIGFFYEGVYKVINDTIKVQFSNPPKSMSWSMTELWYKIIDSNTLVYVSIPIDHIIERNKTRNTATFKLKEHIIQFVPYNSLPCTDIGWLKKRKWFWCDENAYREWNKNRKSR